MYPMKNQPTQRNMPPLPPATLVIDIRGEGEDVISMLEIEIRNLTEEMKQQNIRLWSSLIDFIAFKAIEPVGDDDLTKLNESTQPQDQQNSLTSQLGKAKSPRQHAKSLTGMADQLDSANSFPPQYQTSNLSELEEEEIDLVTPHPDFVELIEKIDHLRNIRINAVSNLGTDGTVGRNVKEPGVRVIFLADARRSNSLVSTASYAHYLKEYYRRLERDNEMAGLQIPVNISVLCLNHQNTDQRVPPARLIQGLRWKESWEHLDALILSEKYRQDIGRVDNETQNLLAELLLYVLLIVSPALARIRPTAPREIEEEDDRQDKKPDDQRVSLPPNTYLVGLSSIENSTRWGYQLLNCGLAEQALYVLLDGNPNNEQATTGPAVESWLHELRMRIRGAIPDRLPKDVPDVRALTLAAKAASPEQNAFSNSQLSLTLGERSIREIEQYRDKLTATYTTASPSQQASTQGSTMYRSPTLQDAILSIPQIEIALDEWESGDPETPLVQAQLDAYRVLSHHRLFQGPRGAVPRGKMQLKELANATATLQGRLAQQPLDMKVKRQALQKSSQDRIDDLKKHNQKWPLFAAALNLKVPMAWFTTILVIFLFFVFSVLSFAVLEQAFEQFAPNVFQWLNDPLFGIPSFTTAYLLLILTLGIFLLVAIFSIGHWLLDENRSPLSVEIFFGLALLAIDFFGLLVELSYRYVNAQQGLNILAWYPPIVQIWVNTVALFMLVVMIAVEIFYYSWWRKELLQERNRIIEDIRAEHQRNIEEVASYIVDRLTLRMLLNAGLGEEKTRNSFYYKRVDELHQLLTKAYTQVREERRLAEGRLGSNLDDSSLRIRQELLDVAALKHGYKRLGASMAHKKNELKELAEILLRAMGEEMPHNIERQLREKAPPTDRETYYIQILMEALTAVALRFSTTIPATDMLTPLEERYNEMDGQSSSQLSSLRLLIEALNKKVKTTDLDQNETVTGSAATKQLDVTLTTRALTAWSQILWEGKDQELDSVLASGGVIAKLVDKGYNSQTVKETLGMRTSPSGRSLITRGNDDLRLFVSPSPESRKFLRDFLPERYIAEFPDSERLLLLHIQHYVARSVYVPRPELKAGTQAPVVDSQPIDNTIHQSSGVNNGMRSVDSTVDSTTTSANLP